MDLARILKQRQSNRMHRRIAPPFIKEPSGPIQMIKIILVRLTPPKFHVANLEIAPEMTRRVPVRLVIMLRPPLTIRQPIPRILLMQILRMRRHEFFGFGPQGRDGLGRVIQVYGEAVGFVVVLHIAKDIVVDVAEEVDIGLDAPVVAGVEQGGVFVEHAAVPTAHLVVGIHFAVLDVLFFENFGRFFKEVVVDPGGDGPVLFGDDF